MKQSRKFTNKTRLKLAALLMFPCALFAPVVAAGNSSANAAETNYTYREGYHEPKNFTNPSFADGSKPFASGNSLSGWTAIESTSAKGMLIDVGAKVESDGEEVENTTFSQNKETYLLAENPETKDSADTRLLMINSKNDSKQSNVQTRKGYKSSTLSLDANSYYAFYVSAKTMKNGDAFAEASVYIDGLKDNNGQAKTLAFEKITPTTWGDYYFFVATGDKAMDVTMQLYLGSKTSDSSGVALFDATSVTKYSSKDFFELCYARGYTGNDASLDRANGKVAFMIDALQGKHSPVADIVEYNFDFEDTSKSFEDNWSVVSHPNGEASIINYDDFEDESGLPKIGNDLSYNNTRGLMLQTVPSTSEYSSNSHVGIKSKDIRIIPQTTYKVSLKLKVADMQSGGFYLKVTENDWIYSVYTDEMSKDEEADNYFALTTENNKTNSFSANTTNAYTNDYQTIDFFIKGHSLYYTSVNLELWLGDSQTSAVGCVMVDDINVEVVNESEVDSTDLLTLNSKTPATTITNASFDKATYDKTKQFPLEASDWENTKENDSKCVSGVVYLDGRTLEGEIKNVYDMMYNKSQNAWAGINPGNPDGSNAPANVYMMYNHDNSYQTLKSPTFELSGQEYYKLSFNYFNQEHSSGNKNASKIKVEVVDSTGIVLFSQDGISSNEEWATMNIFIRSTTSKKHSVYLNVYFGEKDSKAAGIVYLDNFAFTSSNAEEFEAPAATNKTDVTGFYTKLDSQIAESNKVVESAAYKFAATVIDNANFSSSTCGFGGIVRGIDNAYGIDNDKDNFLALTTHGASTISLTSNFTLDFEANGYYTLNFSLATILGEGIDTDDHTCNYGVTIKLDGYGEIANLVTDGTLKDYTIYFKAAESATTPSLIFTLTSDCAQTTGSALLTNLALDKTDADAYSAIKLSQSHGENIFTSEYIPLEDKEEEEEDDKADSTVTADPSTAWIAVPSIITGVALIIGIAAIIFRNVKIKKIEKVKAAAYDNRLNENHQLVMAKAQKVRDEEVERLRQAKKNIEIEKENLEKEHKEFVRGEREKDKGKISRAVEKAFKQYSSRVSTLNEKIKIIDEKIAYFMTAEYLVEVERRIIAKDSERKAKKKAKTTNLNEEK